MKRSLLVCLMLFCGHGGLWSRPRWRRPRRSSYGESGAPFDMTGYWVAVVGEDWRWHMFPNKGDYGVAPLNGEARKIADSWTRQRTRLRVNSAKVTLLPS